MTTRIIRNRRAEREARNQNCGTFSKTLSRFEEVFRNMSMANHRYGRHLDSNIRKIHSLIKFRNRIYFNLIRENDQ